MLFDEQPYFENPLDAALRFFGFLDAGLRQFDSDSLQPNRPPLSRLVPVRTFATILLPLVSDKYSPDKQIILASASLLLIPLDKDS